MRSICQGLNADVSKTEQGIANVKHYIEWIGNRIQENIDRVNKLETARCDASKTYVNGLKNDKIMLKLIAFLRKAVSEKENLNLAQMQGVNEKIQMFVQLFNENHFLKYLEMDSNLESEKKKQDDNVDESKYQVDTNTSEKARTSNYHILFLIFLTFIYLFIFYQISFFYNNKYLFIIIINFKKITFFIFSF